MVYIDDIIVWGSEEDFLHYLRKVYQRLKEHKIILKKKLMSFWSAEDKLLGTHSERHRHRTIALKSGCMYEY